MNGDEGSALVNGSGDVLRDSGAADAGYLSADDQHLLAGILLNPPKANAALREAMESHAKNVEVK